MNGLESDLDPTLLPLDELRALRASLQHDDDAVSYVRRLAQARLDLIDAEMRRRDRHADPSVITSELPVILGSHLTGGPARPPRPAEDASDHPLAIELEHRWAEHGGSDRPSLDDDQLVALRSDLRIFEQVRSKERKALFARIDGLSAELVRRYREGEADVEGLLADD
ncbi:MAG: ABC transporter substrate-binding protein [Actinomycetes bacterium]